MYVEVPAHVRHDSGLQNGVQVRGGTNWDLSRSAVETPITAVADGQPGRAGVDCPCDFPVGGTAYRPEDRLPRGAPATAISFAKGSAALTAEAQDALKSVPRKSVVVLAGNADLNETGPRTLAQRRADSVAGYLRQRGARVELSKGFSNTRFVTTSPLNAEVNRRVDVWHRP